MIFKKAGKKIKYFFKNCVPRWAAVLYIIAALSLVLYITMVNSVGFSDFFNDNIAAYYRCITAFISGLVSISIAEILIYMLIPIFVFFFIGIVKATGLILNSPMPMPGNDTVVIFFLLGFY